jgi:hypothetical protein
MLETALEFHIIDSERALEEKFHLEQGTLQYIHHVFHGTVTAALYLKDNELLEMIKGEHEIQLEINVPKDHTRVSIRNLEKRILIIYPMEGSTLGLTDLAATTVAPLPRIDPPAS